VWDHAVDPDPVTVRPVGHAGGEADQSGFGGTVLRGGVRTGADAAAGGVARDPLAEHRLRVARLDP
jgi:hypothetical protein